MNLETQHPSEFLHSLHTEVSLYRTTLTSYGEQLLISTNSLLEQQQIRDILKALQSTFISISARYDARNRMTLPLIARACLLLE